MDWNFTSLPDDGTEQWKFDMPKHKVQTICEEQICKVFEHLRRVVPETNNCVYGGGSLTLSIV